MKDRKEIDAIIREAERNAASRWAFISEWQVEPQSTDRAPTSGTVATNNGPASVRRAVARRAHQKAYKEWSKERHH
ncbi:MAG TPA: hypothetical protein VGQ39_16835 [Pyrinomonadaceae bacterium]|nr:hypothetical protein [Pyrinomonadaceae bacterium]